MYACVEGRMYLYMHLQMTNKSPKQYGVLPRSHRPTINLFSFPLNAMFRSPPITSSVNFILLHDI